MGLRTHSPRWNNYQKASMFPIIKTEIIAWIPTVGGEESRLRKFTKKTKSLEGPQISKTDNTFSSVARVQFLLDTVWFVLTLCQTRLVGWCCTTEISSDWKEIFQKPKNFQLYKHLWIWHTISISHKTENYFLYSRVFSHRGTRSWDAWCGDRCSGSLFLSKTKAALFFFFFFF